MLPVFFSLCLFEKEKTKKKEAEEVDMHRDQMAGLSLQYWPFTTLKIAK